MPDTPESEAGAERGTGRQDAAEAHLAYREAFRVDGAEGLAEQR